MLGWLAAGMLPALMTIAFASNDIDGGRTIYVEGQLPTGKPLTGLVQGDVAISGAGAACAGCHRRSGYGSSEGGVYVPPITAPILATPLDLNRGRLLDKLFKEVQSSRFRARMRSLQGRPAYDPATLAAAIRDGVSVSGRALDPAMPRYALNEQEMSELLAFLGTLSAIPDPGVEATTIQFATIVTEDAAASERASMLATIEAFFAWMNADTHGDLHRPNFSPTYRSELVGAYRTWQLNVWELRGPPETWPVQLEQHYIENPVFAVVSGLVAGPYAPIDAFCEQKLLPCLFPHTDLPAAPANYSLYFNDGLKLEAQVIADYLLGQRSGTEPVRQVFADEPQGQVPQQALVDGLRARGVEIRSTSFRTAGELVEALNAAQDSAADLVVWPGRDVNGTLRNLLAHMPNAARVFMPSTAIVAAEQLVTGEHSRLRFAYPYELPSTYRPQLFRIRAWMRSRGVPIVHPRLQFDTYYSLELLQYGLEHMADAFSRDYLIERIEHEAEKALNPGTYPRLSLGPGQRFASKGAYIVELGPSDQALLSRSDWVVPELPHPRARGTGVTLAPLRP